MLSSYRALKLLGEGNFNPPHSYQFDARASEKCPAAVEGLQFSTAPEKQHKGISATSGSKSASLSAT